MKWPMVSLVIASALVASVACGGGERDPQEHVRRADDYLRQEQYRPAIVELRTAIQINPALAEARAKLSDAYRAIGEEANALREAVRAADLRPDDAHMQVRAGTLLLSTRSFDDANARAERALALDPTNTEALVLKGSVLAGLRSFDAALSTYEKAIANRPEDEASYIGIGAVELARGKTGEAEKIFRRAIEANPTSIGARIALANLYWNERKLDAAETELRAASQREPQNALVNRALGILYLSTNRAAEAEAPLTAYAKALGTAAGNLTLANYYLNLQRNDDARLVLERAAATPDGFEEATNRLAALDVLESKLADARTKVESVLTKDPRNVDGLVLKAQLLSMDQKYQDALAVIAAALSADSNAAGAHLMAGSVYGALNQTEDAIGAYESALKSPGRDSLQSFEANVKLGGIHYQLGAMDTAATHAQSALRLQPTNANATLLMARIEAARGELGGARNRLAALEKAAPGSAAVAVLRGHIELAAKRPEAAAAAFREGLKREASNLEALAGLTRIDLESGRRTEAVARIDAALQQPMPSAAIYVLAAQTYSAADQTAKAEHALRAAIDRDPNRFDAYNLLGRLYATQKKLPEAIQQFETVLARNPKSVGAATALGMLQEGSGRKAEAEKTYERALAIDSRAAVAANNLAWLLVDSKRDLDRALGLAQTARSRLPNDPNVADTLGWIFVRKQLAAQAIPHLSFAARTAARNPVIHYHLGMAYAGNGDTASARRALQQALAMGQSFPDADAARQALETLK